MTGVLGRAGGSPRKPIDESPRILRRPGRGWGGTPGTSEFGPDDNRRFKLQFTANGGSRGMSYRVDPIAGTSPTIVDFRAGMDAMP